MKNYKKKLSLIFSLLLSLSFNCPNDKAYGEYESTLSLTENQGACLDLSEPKIRCLSLDDDDDDEDTNVNESKTEKNKTFTVKKSDDKVANNENLKIHNVVNVVVDGAFAQTNTLQNQVKNGLHSTIDSFTDPYKFCCWLASSVALRGASNSADVFIFDNILRKDLLKTAEKETRNKDWATYESELKDICFGLGWIDHRESGIKTRTFSTLRNYLDYISYLAFSTIKDINEISYGRVMADKNGTNWVYTLTWNHILKQLGFATKIYKVKSDEFFFNQEYVIVFANRLNNNTKIHLLTPFLAKRTNKVDNLFSDKVLREILENGADNEIVLEDVDNRSDTIKLKVGDKITDYFDYAEDTKLLSKKKLEG